MKHTYDFATKQELDLIHKYSMKTLEESGAKFMSTEVIEIFKSHGFRTEDDVVFITEQDVMNALKTCPSSFDWYGRTSSVKIGGGKSILAPAYGPVFVLEDGAYHKCDQRDYLNFTKLHATSKVLDVSNPNMLDFNFMPSQYASNWAMATTLMLDERPAIGMVDGKKNASDSIKMAQEFYGIYDKTVVVGLISVASPVHFSGSMCEGLIEYAKAGQGVFITPSSLNSLTVPGSLASLLMINNVEVLAGVVLAQLINPGTPVIYGNQSHGCDLRYAAPTMGSAEQCLIFSAAKAMGQYYNLPVRTGGSSCDAKLVDIQAGVESFSTMYFTLQSGADLMVHACGSLDSDNSLSYDKFIVDEESVVACQRINRGIEITEETLLYDCVKEIGPGGTFLDLSDDLLVDCTDAYRNDYTSPTIANRVGRSLWESNGRETMEQRASKAWKKRVADYEMPQLDAAQRAILEKYVPKELLEF